MYSQAHLTLPDKFHRARHHGLWPSWSLLVAVMVCGRHGHCLWPSWFVAVIVEPQDIYRDHWTRSAFTYFRQFHLHEEVLQSLMFVGVVCLFVHSFGCSLTSSQQLHWLAGSLQTSTRVINSPMRWARLAKICTLRGLFLVRIFNSYQFSMFFYLLLHINMFRYAYIFSPSFITLKKAGCQFWIWGKFLCISYKNK